ncbi:hypothetical protein WA158_004134 [Blastocystis sp. Blastoise]
MTSTSSVYMMKKELEQLKTQLSEEEHFHESAQRYIVELQTSWKAATKEALKWYPDLKAIFDKYGKSFKNSAFSVEERSSSFHSISSEKEPLRKQSSLRSIPSEEKPSYSPAPSNLSAAEIISAMSVSSLNSSPQHVSYWECPQCTFGENDMNQLKCTVCGAKRPSLWVCSFCGANNSDSESKCVMCTCSKDTNDTSSISDSNKNNNNNNNNIKEGMNNLNVNSQKSYIYTTSQSDTNDMFDWNDNNNNNNNNINNNNNNNNTMNNNNNNINSNNNIINNNNQFSFDQEFFSDDTPDLLSNSPKNNSTSVSGGKKYTQIAGKKTNIFQKRSKKTSSDNNQFLSSPLSSNSNKENNNILNNNNTNTTGTINKSNKDQPFVTNSVPKKKSSIGRRFSSELSPQEDMTVTWICPACGAKNNQDNTSCILCGKDGHWQCILCNYTDNLPIYTECYACGEPKQN